MNIAQSVANRLIENVSRVVLGKQHEIKQIVVGFLCQGHILLEDVPGVGKTMMAKALATSIGAQFKRIQFTPDMLPSDITGVSIYNQGTGEFQFRPGPIFAQIVLTDEINRATPKTQAALLEAMEERQVTVEGETYGLQQPFLVMATQNPIEYEGTFPLPEAQLDRFMVRVHLGYPSAAEEITMLEAQQYQHPIEQVKQAVTVDELMNAQRAVREIYSNYDIKQYIINLVGASRAHPDVYLGASPRGAIALFRTSQAWAALEGREYIIPDDIKAVAEVTLAHRIIIGPSARIKDISSRTIVQQVLAATPIPGATVGARY